uniref:FA complementation group M n=1 Tax=Poecilia formosa TaxID=48698 RepID=A0A096M7Q3_POEFO
MSGGSNQRTLFQTWGASVSQNKAVQSGKDARKATGAIRTSSSRAQEDEDEDDDDLMVVAVYEAERSLQFKNSGFDSSSADVWIYPTNYPIRDYQLKISEASLFQNTLVCLPTGLGKTFIASVVMYNFYRWYPAGKIVFMAPTKPLVAQQIEACYKVMGIPQDHMAELTGSTAAKQRQEVWKSKRVFFLTPQVMVNDLSRETCPAKEIKCVVIDEAHKALGNHAYCQSVQSVISNLLISHIELRSEESPDIQAHSHQRSVEKVVVPLGEKLSYHQTRYLQVLEKFMSRLVQSRVMGHKDLRTLSKYQLILARDQFRKNPPPHIKGSHQGVLEGDFALCISLYHGYELLTQMGLRSLFFYIQGIMDGSREMSRAKNELQRTPTFMVLYQEMETMFLTPPDGTWVTHYTQTQYIHNNKCPFIYSHPKLEKLEEVVLQHFNAWAQSSAETNDGVSTRVMIFSSFRESVQEIASMLNRHAPLIRVMTFMGQASAGKGVKGFTQKEQLEVVHRFRQGGFNTLVSTCVGEEGLDIGEVDLIVCFDAQKSPIRLVQRMGRTGRKRQGRIVVILTEGREERTYNQSQSNKRSVYKSITGNRNGFRMYPSSPRMLPEGVNPQLHKMHITSGQFDHKESSRRSVRGRRSHAEGRASLIHPQNLIRQESSTSDGFLSRTEYSLWSSTMRLEEHEAHPTLKPSHFMSIPSESTPQVSSFSSSLPELSLWEWRHWQHKPLPFHAVDHSLRCRHFTAVMQLIDGMRDESEEIYFNLSVNSNLISESHFSRFLFPHGRGTSATSITNQTHQSTNTENQIVRGSASPSAHVSDETLNLSKYLYVEKSTSLIPIKVLLIMVVQKKNTINQTNGHYIIQNLQKNQYSRIIHLKQAPISYREVTSNHGKIRADCTIHKNLVFEPKVRIQQLPASFAAKCCSSLPPETFTFNNIHSNRGVSTLFFINMQHKMMPTASLCCFYFHHPVLPQYLRENIKTFTEHLPPPVLGSDREPSDPWGSHFSRITSSDDADEKRQKKPKAPKNCTKNNKSKPSHSSRSELVYIDEEAEMEDAASRSIPEKRRLPDEQADSPSHNSDDDCVVVDQTLRDPANPDDVPEDADCAIEDGVDAQMDESMDLFEDDEAFMQMTIPDIPTPEDSITAQATIDDEGIEKISKDEDKDCTEILIAPNKTPSSDIRLNIHNSAEDHYNKASFLAKANPEPLDSSHDLFSVNFDLGYSLEDSEDEAEVEVTSPSPKKQAESAVSNSSTPRRSFAGLFRESKSSSQMDNWKSKAEELPSPGLQNRTLPERSKNQLKMIHCKNRSLRESLLLIQVCSENNNLSSFVSLDNSHKSIYEFHFLKNRFDSAARIYFFCFSLAECCSDSEEEVVLLRRRHHKVNPLSSPEVSKILSDVDSPVAVKKNRPSVLNTTDETQAGDFSDDDFQNCSIFMHRKTTTGDQRQQVQQPSNKNPRGQKARQFLDEEAELSEDDEGADVSSDEEDSADLDRSLEGFVVDNMHLSQGLNDSEMRGVYLKSVRSPAVRGKFKMSYKNHQNMDIFSQVPEMDETYAEDSFVVGSDEEDGESNEEEPEDVELLPDVSLTDGRRQYATRRRIFLHKARAGLETDARTQPAAEQRTRTKRSRVICLNESSEEETEEVGKNQNPDPSGQKRASSAYASVASKVSLLSKEQSEEQQHERLMERQTQSKNNKKKEQFRKNSSFGPQTRGFFPTAKTDILPKTTENTFGCVLKVALPKSPGSPSASSAAQGSAPQDPVPAVTEPPPPPLPGSVSILMDSRSTGGMVELVMSLRQRHGADVHVCSLDSNYFIVSNRMAVMRQSQSDLAAMQNRKRLAERLSNMQGLFERVCLIVEKDRSKQGEVSRPFQRTRYYDNTLVALVRAGIRLLWSDGAEESAGLLVDLAKLESRKGQGIAVPLKVKGQRREEALQMYLSLPSVSHVHALNLLHNFSSVAQLMNSSVESIQKGGCMSRSRAEEIYRFLRRSCDCTLFTKTPKAGKIG